VSFKIADLPIALGEHQYQVSNLWSVLVEPEMEDLVDWLEVTGIDASLFTGYGDIRFLRREDRTLFLLRYSQNDNYTTEDWY